MTLLLALLAPPLAAALLACAIAPSRRLVRWVNGALSLVSLAGALALWAAVLQAGVVVDGPAEVFRVDALSAVLATVVSAVAALAAWWGPGPAPDDGCDADQRRRFRFFANLFAFTMLFAVTTNNVGFMWVAIEATTITSGVLIPLHRTKASVEASWKYLLLGSVGIALALAGTVLGYFDFVNQVGRGQPALNWNVLMTAAPALHPEIMRLAFVFLVVGYGTKAGLAPMHTWLPDAHSEAPAALSAMMSGVLLAVALYAIVRWKAVTDVAVGRSFGDGLLLVLGLASLTVAAFSLVFQRNCKRMLAYSSIEHTGLACIGLGLGPLGVAAAMLHLLNHALTKAVLFLLAGRVLHRYGSADLRAVSGLARTMPGTAVLFGAGTLALMGLPPFGLFVSEFLIARAGFAAGRPWLTASMLALLSLAFVALLRHLAPMLYGVPRPAVAAGEHDRWLLVPLAAALAAVLALGLTVPPPVAALLQRVAEATAP